MTARGQDGAGGVLDSADTLPIPQWTGRADFVGLIADTIYTFIVEQDGETLDGTLHTDPAGDFVMWFIGCDGPVTPQNDTDFAPGLAPNYAPQDYGMFPLIRADAEDPGTPPVVAMTMPDDIGYRDGGWTDDVGASGTGFFCHYEPKDAATPTEYSYCVADMGYFGLYTDFTWNGWNLVNKLASKGLRQRRFIHPDRQWCYHNIGFYPGIGDHEFRGSQAEGVRDTDAMKAAAFNSFLTSIAIGAPDPLAGGANGYCYTHKFGPVEIINFDRESNNGDPVGFLNSFNASYNSGEADLSQMPTGFPYIGDAQIDSLLADIDLSGATPFKIVSAPCDTHYQFNRQDRVATVNFDDFTNPLFGFSTAMGHQQPIDGYGNDKQEWERFMTSDGSVTPAGLLKLCEDNSAQAYWLTADRHYHGVRYHYKQEYAGAIQEELLQIYAGTVNGQKAHYLHDSVRNVRRVLDGTEYIYIPDYVVESGVRPSRPSALRIHVKPNAVPPEVNYQLWDQQDGKVWEISSLLGDGNIPPNIMESSNMSKFSEKLNEDYQPLGDDVMGLSAEFGGIYTDVGASVKKLVGSFSQSWVQGFSAASNEYTVDPAAFQRLTANAIEEGSGDGAPYNTTNSFSEADTGGVLLIPFILPVGSVGRRVRRFILPTFGRATGTAATVYFTLYDAYNGNKIHESQSLVNATTGQQITDLVQSLGSPTFPSDRVYLAVRPARADGLIGNPGEALLFLFGGSDETLVPMKGFGVEQGAMNADLINSCLTYPTGDTGFPGQSFDAVDSTIVADSLNLELINYLFGGPPAPYAQISYNRNDTPPNQLLP